MPELPEVETIKRGLMKFIVKEKLVGVDVLCEKSWVGDGGAPGVAFRTIGAAARTMGATDLAAIDDGHSGGSNGGSNGGASGGAADVTGVVTGMRRYGKALVIDLDTGVSLMIHLRMTGQLIFRGAGNRDKCDAKRCDVDLIEWGHDGFAGGHPSENFVAELPNKQTRVILYFTNGTLYFNDQRKFGFIKVLKSDQVEQDNFIKKLAPEPWEMATDELYQRLQRHQGAPIKAVILDQGVICGLGNIYADEALFAAMIHPLRKAGSLTYEETDALLKAARAVMERSIESGGSTMATYVKADGTRGDYLELFAQVFRREGKPCVRCGAEIVKIRVAGRGTHVCPECQRLETTNGAIDDAMGDANVSGGIVNGVGADGDATDGDDVAGSAADDSKSDGASVKGVRTKVPKNRGEV